MNSSIPTERFERCVDLACVLQDDQLGCVNKGDTNGTRIKTTRELHKILSTRDLTVMMGIYFDARIFQQEN